MCGISGLLSARDRHDADELQKLVGTMADTQVHRGPDGEGCWVDPAAGIALSHRRLAIVGLGEVGHQPMVSSSGRWVVTYNGEIYNALSLTARLEAEGRRFRGTSDTEVL